MPLWLSIPLVYLLSVIVMLFLLRDRWIRYQQREHAYWVDQGNFSPWEFLGICAAWPVGVPWFILYDRYKARERGVLGPSLLERFMAAGVTRTNAKMAKQLRKQQEKEAQFEDTPDAATWNW